MDKEGLEKEAELMAKGTLAPLIGQGWDSFPAVLEEIQGMDFSDDGFVPS